MTRIKKSKSQILFGSLLIIIGFTLPIIKYSNNYYLEKRDEKKVEDFFNNTIIKENDINVKNEEIEKIEEKVIQEYDYIAILEIPSISLKRGLVSKTDKNNRISKNIQILKESDMPNVLNGNLILASHSGSSNVSFFKNLFKLKNNDLIYVYYEGYKYTYKVTNSYLEVKDGNIFIKRNNNINTLTLTTCKDDMQLVIISELESKEIY